MSKISVLVAAYNVEKYIAEAMSSVIAQTLKDIEIVAVDDCSTDKTFEIITKYAELDSRIKVVRHKQNGGILRTRRDGFLNSSGDYIMFLDGDDTLTPDACEKAYKAMVTEQVDMLEFGFDVSFITPASNNEYLEQNLRNELRSIDHKAVSISKAGILDHKATGGVISSQLWNKIYRREILEKAVTHLPDEYLNMADDVFFSFFMHYYVHTYNYIPTRLYIYKFGCGMSTTDKLSPSLMISISKMAYVYHYLCDFVKKMDVQKECKSALQRVFMKTYYGIAGNYFYRVPKEQREEFVSEVMKHGTPEDLVLAISEHLYTYSVTGERVAEDCAGLDIFSSKKTKAKTIGIYYFRVYNGGVENVISSLSDMWIKQGYNVVLFTDEKPNKQDYYINPAVKRVIVPSMKDTSFSNRKDRIDAFRKGLIDNDVDVMIYNAWVNPDLVFDEMIIKSCGVNLIIHTHNLFCCEVDHNDGYYAYLYSSLPKLYAFVDSVVAITDVDAAWWKSMGYKTLKTINPIQYDLTTPTAPLNGNNLLLVSRISYEKQVIDAIKIAERVKKDIPDVKLTIVGKGDDQNYINAVDNYIETNKLHDVVDMVGFKLDVLPYYLSSDIVLSTALFEGFGLTLMESKICGVPLVCYELPNLDITRNSKGMVIIDQLDVKAAADAIVKILKNDALKKEIGRQARESVEEFYRVDIADIWKNIFEQSLLPKNERTPIYKLPAIEASMRIAVDKYTTGIKKRLQTAQQAQYHASRCAELEAKIEQTNAKYIALDAKYVALDKLYLEVDARYVALDKQYLALDARYVALDKKYLELDAGYVKLDERRAEAEAKCDEYNSARMEAEEKRIEAEAKCDEYNSARTEAEAKCDELNRQLASYIAELAEFKHSKSYRIGRLITFVPRKIKALLKKIFRRNKV